MKKYVVTLLILLCLATPVYARERVTFSKCVDGDTIKVNINGKEETVRFLAVDTPESVHPTKEVQYYGKEASEYTCKTVSEGQKIELEYDEGSDKRDKYDRLLAWVFVDDVLLQDELIKNGYAEVAYLYGDYKYTSLLQDHQSIAEGKKIGIWNDEGREAFSSESDSNVDDKGEEDSVDLSKMTTEDFIIFGVSLVVVVVILPLIKKGKRKIKKLLR